MLVLDFRLTALVLLFLPLIFLLVNLYRKKSVKIIEKTRSLLSDINSKLAENIEGIRIIQAFNQEKRLQAEFDEINQEHLVYVQPFCSLGCPLFASCHEFAETPRLRRFDGLFWLPWSFYRDNGRNHVCLYPVYQSSL